MPLVELAGPKHYKHLYEIFYFYNWSFDKTTVYKRRHHRDIALMQTPYKNLPSLEHPAMKEENYEVNERMKWEYENDWKIAKVEAKKYNREIDPEF